MMGVHFRAVHTWWYIREHPVTEALHPCEQLFVYNPANGEWELPANQPSLPHMAEGSDLYDSRDEALAALLTGEWKADGDGEVAD